MSPDTTEKRVPATEALPRASQRDVRWITPSTLGWALLVTVSIVTGLSMAEVHPAIPLGAAIGLLSLVLLYRYPFLGVLAYLALEYARIPAMFPVLQPLNLGKVIVVATAASWLARMIMTKEYHFVRDKVNVLMVLWMFLAFISCVDAVEPGLALTGSVGLAKFVGVYYLFVNLVTDVNRWNWCIVSLTLLHVKLSQFQLRMYMAGLQEAVDRYRYVGGGMGAGSGGFFGNSTDFGAAMCVMAPLVMYLFLRAKSRWVKMLGGLSFLLFVASILRSGSRGAAVSLLAMAAVWWIKTSHKLISAIVIVCFVGGFWVAAPVEWKQRFMAAKQYDEDATASHRLVFWAAGLHMMVTHPFNGVGMDNFTPSFREMGGDGFVAHSIWIEAASELGVFGIGLVLAIAALGFIRNAQTRKLAGRGDPDARYLYGMADALDLSLAGFLVAGTFTSILYYPFIFMTLALIVSLHHIVWTRHGPGEVAGAAT